MTDDINGSYDSWEHQPIPSARIAHVSLWQRIASWFRCRKIRTRLRLSSGRDVAVEALAIRTGNDHLDVAFWSETRQLWERVRRIDAELLRFVKDTDDEWITDKEWMDRKR